MVQIRSADEPMTSFYKVRCAGGKERRESADEVDSVLLVGASGRRIEALRWMMMMGWDKKFGFGLAQALCLRNRNLRSFTWFGWAMTRRTGGVRILWYARRTARGDRRIPTYLRINLDKVRARTPGSSGTQDVTLNFCARPF